MRVYRQQNQHRPKKNLLITGIDAIINAINSGDQLERIYLNLSMHSEEINNLKSVAETHGVPVNKVPLEKLKGFNVDDCQVCIAVRSKVQYQDLQDVISFNVEKGETLLLLLLDGITDIRNIGALARTALCCGVHAIVIPEKGVGALNEDAIATSAGALESLAVCRVKSLLQALETLRLNGIKIFASDMKANINVYDLNFQEPCAVIMGSEDKGIQPALYKLCDDRFKISMKNDFESLNVSVAAAMILYEAMKQRNFSVPEKEGFKAT